MKAQLLARRAGRHALIFGAAYNLWMVKRVYFGAVANDDARPHRPSTAASSDAVAMLAIAVLWMGITHSLHRRDARVGDGAARARRQSKLVPWAGRINMNQMNWLAIAPEVAAAGRGPVVAWSTCGSGTRAARRPTC